MSIACLRRGVLALLLACLAPWAIGPARAHEYPLDIAVSAFVKVDGTRAEVLVRAPLFLFHADRFPIKGSDLDLTQARPALDRASESLKRSVFLLRDGRTLTPQSVQTTLSLPSDRSFDDFDSASAHIAAPLQQDLEITVDQGYVDARMSFQVESPQGEFALRTQIAPDLGEALKLTIRWIPPTGDARAFLVSGGAGTVDLEPSRLGAAKGFIGLGVAHILGGFDHLLFLLCIIVPLRGARQLLAVVTAFTVGHSFTLISSALGLTPEDAWFPPFVEVLIALSIVYTAIDNIVGVDLRRRIALAMGFGLVHGLGFSYALKEQLQFAGSHLLTSLFAFNVGIELGQLAVLLGMLPLLWALRRWVVPGRVGAIVLSAIVAHTGWHWMLERWDLLMRQKLPEPAGHPLWLVAVAIAVVGAVALMLAPRLRQLRLGAAVRPVKGLQP